MRARFDDALLVGYDPTQYHSPTALTYHTMKCRKGGARKTRMTVSTVIKTLGLVLSLGLDTFAVAIGLGLSGLSRRDRYRYGATFALAEGIMPLLGFLLGQVVAAAVGEIASYAAIALLLGVGLYFIWEALQEENPEYTALPLLSVLSLAISISLDELAVGFSLGLLHIPILLAVVLISLQAFVLTLIGTAAGSALGDTVAERASLLSGVVLSILSLFLLGERLLSA